MPAAAPVPVILYDATKATEAYEIHQALVWLEIRHPELRRNARWCRLREGAFDEFRQAFEVSQ